MEFVTWVFHALKKSLHLYCKKYLFYLLYSNISIGFYFQKTLSKNSIHFSIFTWPQILSHITSLGIVIFFFIFLVFIFPFSPSLFESHIFTPCLFFLPLFLIILKDFFYYLPLWVCLYAFVGMYVQKHLYVCVCMFVVYMYVCLCICLWRPEVSFRDLP